MSCSVRLGVTRAVPLFVLLASTAMPVAAEVADVQAVTTLRSGEDRAKNDAPASDDITVTAAGYEQNIVKAPASVSIISRAELEMERFNSLADALTDVEGVDVGGTAGKTGGLNISIRGMDSEYTLVLLDGRRQNSPGSVTPNGFGETSTSFMPPLAAINRIEVVRGPMSTLYGSDAMGGVINIITRKVGTNWVGTLSANTTLQGDGDFGNTYGANGYAQGPVIRDLVGLSVRGSYIRRDASALTYTDANGNPAVVSTRGPSPVESDIYTLGGRLTFTPHADHDLWVEYDYSHQLYDNSASQLGTGTVQGGYGPEMKFVRDQYVLAHSWRAGIGTLDTTLTRNTTETFGRTIPPGTPGRTAGDARELRATNTILDTRLVSEVGQFVFTAGGQYWWARMRDGVAPEQYAFDQWAGFLEGSWKLAEQFTLTLGGRYDHHSTFGGKFSPRAYAVWTPHEIVTIKGGVSRGFKTPRLEQIAEGITGFGGQGTIPLLGTPTLTPETSTTTEIGVYLAPGGGFSGNVTLFNNDFNDKIASGQGVPNCAFAAAPNRPGCVNVGNFPNVDLFGQSVNIDKAVTRGIEVSGRMEVTPRLTVTTNYTYTESEQKTGTEAGKPLIGTPRHMLNGQIRWRATDDFNLWTRGEVRSGRYRGANAAQTALGDFQGYELMHIGAGYTVRKGITLNATLYNVFNTDFVQYLPYRNGNSTAYAQQYSNNQEPRRVFLSVKVDF